MPIILDVAGADPDTYRLPVYNGALRLCGERKLASLDEERESRRLLDDIWEGGALRFVLELGQWNFAIRTVQLTYSPSASQTTFGYRYGFNRPDDLVRTVGLSADEYFVEPFLQYQSEGGFWWADIDTLYVRYVSDDPEYGGDLSLWPMSFRKLMEAYLAKELAPRLKNASGHERIDAEFIRCLADAKAKDAMEEPSVIQPRGSWVRARGRGVIRRNR